MNEKTLSGLLETCWQHLGRGRADRHHPARHPTLATMGPDGPDLRTLVLRHVSRAEGMLEFHTDALSPKVTHIANDPRVAIHVWIPRAQLQIRARGRAEVLPGDPAVFGALPPQAQANYQGQIPGAATDAPVPGTTDLRFVRLICTVTEIDLLHLGDPHQRAIYQLSDQWKGQWVAP